MWQEVDPLIQRSQKARRGSTRVCSAIFCLTCSFLLSTSLSFAQALYLDADGDGPSTEADVLNAQPNPTVIRVYLDTTRNGDGSPAFCSTGTESLDVNRAKTLHSFLAARHGSLSSHKDSQ